MAGGSYPSAVGVFCSPSQLSTLVFELLDSLFFLPLWLLQILAVVISLSLLCLLFVVLKSFV